MERAIRPILESGEGAVDWRLNPSAGPPTPKSTVIHVLVTERTCASGQPVGDRLLGPEVVVTDTEALVALASQPQGGAQPVRVILRNR